MTPEQEAAIAAAKARIVQPAQFSAAQQAAIDAAKDRTVKADDGSPAGVRRKAMLENIARAKSGETQISPESAGGHAYATSMAENAMNDTAGGAFLGSLAKGVSFGFNDEIAAGVGSLLENRSYDEILAGLRARDQQVAQNNPKSALAGEIVGAVASPASKIGAGWAASGETLGRVALRGAVVGGGQGAVYGFGSGEGGAGERLKGAGIGASLGAAAGGAVPYIARGAQKLIGALTDRKAVNAAISEAKTPDELRALASQLYDQAEQFTSLPRDEFTSAMDNVLQKAERMGLDADLMPGAAKVASRIEDAATSPSPEIGFRELDILRRKAAVPAGNVQNRAEASLGSQMIEGIDNYIAASDQNLSGIVGDAREMWGRLRRVETVEKAIDRAKSAASGFENGLRVEFRKILNNPKLARGFNEREIAAIKTVVSGTKLGNTMRQLGRMGLGIGGQSNGLGATVSGMGATALGGPLAGLAAVATGTASKLGAEAATRAAANRAMGIIASRPDIPAQAALQIPAQLINRLAPAVPAAIPAYNALRGR